MKARVTVTLKTGILDPQGKAIEGALRSLGVAGVTAVRQGKVFRHRNRGRRPRAGRDFAQAGRRQAPGQYRDRELPGRPDWLTLSAGCDNLVSCSLTGDWVRHENSCFRGRGLRGDPHRRRGLGPERRRQGTGQAGQRAHHHAGAGARKMGFSLRPERRPSVSTAASRWPVPIRRKLPSPSARARPPKSIPKRSRATPRSSCPRTCAPSPPRARL